MKDSSVYLHHILEAIEKVELYCAEGREAFMANPMAQDAVIRNFEIIGEAAKRLDDAIRDSGPKRPGVTSPGSAMS